MKKYLLILFTGAFLFSSWSAYAQEGGLFISRGAGSFFIAIIAGIVLAFAFQFILANLAVALGISAIGDIRKKKGGNSSNADSSSDSSGSTPTGVKISTGAGIFMLVTLSLSLFFASMIAVRLSLVPGNITGFTLGLVIWAGTFLLGVYIDSKLISGLSGSVFGLVKSAFSATASAADSLFGSSTESKVKHTAHETVKAIHKEIRDEYDLSGFQQKMDDYVSRLEPQRIDTENLHEHLLDLLDEIEVREKYTPNDPDASRRLFLDIAEKQKGLSGKDKENLKNAFDEAREAFKRKGSRADKAAVLADKFTPGDERQGREYRMKVVDYLKKTRRQELDPDNLKEDLNEILHNPSAAPAVVKARVSQIDRTTLKTALVTDGISERQAEKVISTAEDVINKIKNTASSTQSQVSQTRTEKSQQFSDTADESRQRAEMAIRNWFDRMGQPELEYDRLRADVEIMMDDPKAAPAVLKSRLRRLDRESLIALISNNKRISREQAEKAVLKIEEARDNVIRKAEEIENEVKLRVKKARNETLKQAEAARKTAAAAAWWLLIAAVVSGGASALGGILAYTL